MFIPSTKPSDPTEARLLILDGHGSHETTDFMYLCYHSNIHLLFLPPHTSHVLQPLDLSVFSPLKRSYRKELAFLLPEYISSVTGKQYMIKCYYKARKEALASKNIQSGWRATGLWPTRMAKPLMSPLLLENRNTASRNTNQDISILETIESNSEWLRKTSAISWVTPRRAEELREQTGQFTASESNTATSRLLFQKIAKSFDEKDIHLASTIRKIEALEAQLEVVKPKKRKKVKTSPNSKFANIGAIHRAQLEANGPVIITDESEDSDQSTDEEDCIQVA